MGLTIKVFFRLFILWFLDKLSDILFFVSDNLSIEFFPLNSVNRSFKLFEDGKILEGRTLAELASLSRPFSKVELKKIENYSNSLKDLFEKQEAKFKKTNEKVMDKLGEKIIQYAELECNSPDVRGLKN